MLWPSSPFITDSYSQIANFVIIPNKGWKITQCEQYRVESKVRSALIKCSHADSSKLRHAMENCLYLWEDREMAGAECHGGINAEYDRNIKNAPLIASAQERECCCHHRGICSYALFLRKFGEVASSQRQTNQRLREDGASI